MSPTGSWLSVVPLYAVPVFSRGKSSQLIDAGNRRHYQGPRSPIGQGLQRLGLGRTAQ